MYVSLMGKMGSYLDVANERKELARSALTTAKKRGLRRHFDTEAEFFSLKPANTFPLTHHTGSPKAHRRRTRS